MSKKKSQLSAMQQLTPAQQNELIQRYKNRKDVRAINRQLAALVLGWVLGNPLNEQQFMEQFNAGGHYGEYHEYPEATTTKRVLTQITELGNLKKRLEDTPLDYMGAVELSYVYQRIQVIIEILSSISGGTMKQAIELYENVGTYIRQKVYDEMGHWPEQFPIPHGRITGKESEHQFRLVDHQPTLLGEE